MQLKKFSEEMPKNDSRILAICSDGEGATSWLICEDGNVFDWQGDEVSQNEIMRAVFNDKFSFGWIYMPDDYRIWFEID